MRMQLPNTERIVDLPATAAAAGIARRELATTPGIAGDIAYKALLMTSELIAVYVENVEPDPGAKLCLAILVDADRVRIEVGGQAPEMSPDELLHSRGTPSLGGMGLQIVERMADAWGLGDEAGSMMWFELARTRAAAA